jgi:tRNA(adenine34) deaminase
MNDEQYMRDALREAHKARRRGEVPVGAVLVRNGEIIARGGNRREISGNILGHAEIEVLRKAARSTGTWRMHDTTMFVTLEPCPMCVGALLQARVGRLVYGARDLRYGACGSVLNVADCPGMSVRMQVRSGVLEEECGALVREFFSSRRQRARLSEY